jgi:hypothetical protein
MKNFQSNTGGSKETVSTLAIDIADLNEIIGSISWLRELAESRGMQGLGRDH